MLVRIQSSALKFELPVRITSTNNEKSELTLRSNDFVLTRRRLAARRVIFHFEKMLQRRNTIMRDYNLLCYGSRWEANVFVITASDAIHQRSWLIGS